MAFVVTEGVVAKTFYNGLGARIEERFKTRSGEEAKKSYTLFTEQPHGLQEGDAVKASGLLSVKVREYEVDGDVRHTADVVINGKAEVTSQADDSSPF